MKMRPITRHLIAGAVLMALPIWVEAAGLGRLVVNSALGQPMAAEIELIAADKAELDSISAGLANTQAFQDAKIDFAPALTTLHFAVERKPNGKAVVKVTSSKPVNDPFLDMLVELNWASGRLVREYTVLLDPPGMATAQTVAPVSVAVPVAKGPPPAVKPAPSPAPAAAVTTAIPSETAAAAPAGKHAGKAVKSHPKTTPAEEKPEAAKARAAAPAGSTEGPIRVKRGDTLSKIARRVKPGGVTLDQTLVGLFQANGGAFEGNNMNRLKAGAKLKLPQADEMALVSAQKARQEIQLQASDWQAYRQKLAEGVARAPETPAAKGQVSAGKITSRVEEAHPKPAEPKDVLKLSRAPTPSTTGAATAQAEAAKAEDAAAKAKAQKEASARAAMLEKQIQDMQKLVDEKAKKQEAAKAAAAAAAKTANAAAAKAAKPAPAPTVAAPVASPSWTDTFKDNPFYVLGGGAVVLLGGALWWMMAGTRRRKPISTFDDSMMTVGDVKPNTIVAASGGAVNTGDTSFLTDFSQAGMGNIDTHDVDPIAEAEVYMAYGRDAQAEEILKEALNKTPDRQEIRLKLLEIYAARKNVGAFEKVARELHAAVGDEESPSWQKAAEMGRALDPGNPLYGGKPAQEEEIPETALPAATAETPPTESAEAEAPPAVHVPAEQSPEAVAFETAGEVLNFDSHMDTMSGNVEVPEQEASKFAETLAGLNFDISDLDVKPEADEKHSVDLGTDLGAEDDNKLDFSGLDLNLNEELPDEDMDEVTTKLDLARAYLEMGDKEGAREILQEVIAEGNTNQQASARSMLGSI
jgi:pilus assembly protein FimV